MNARVNARRAFGKAKRAALRPRLVRWQVDYGYYARLGRHSERLPWPSTYPHELLGPLREEHVVTVDGSPYFDDQVVAAAQDLAAGLVDVNPTASTVEVTFEAHRLQPSVYRWGLEQAQLDLAEWYIGLPVQYLGVAIKLERADATVADTRQWHRDVEDRRMLKMITYLSDVDDTAGPFGYLPREVSDAAAEELDYWSGFITEDRLASVLPREEWCSATGPKLTTTFVDTCRLLHRATPPTGTDRYSMTFSYCSKHPFQRYDEMLPCAAQIGDLTAGMSPRQVRSAAFTVRPS